jgi:hypothetical protein
MSQFEHFDRKSSRKEQLDSRKKNKKYLYDTNEEQRFSKVNKKNIKRKLQEMKQEEKWEDWEENI